MGRRHKQTFLFQRRLTDGKKKKKKPTHEKMLNILIITEMQIQTAVRYQLILVRMAIITKSINNKCWRGCEEKGIFLHCWWECKVG